MGKRFYKTVEIKSGAGEGAEGEGFVITLDGRVLKTPDGKVLACPQRFQAELVAQEWRAQGEEIVPQSMPCTRLMSVAVSQTPGRRPELIDEYVKYTGTDLLCYRAASPEDLAQRQRESWQVWLDWAAAHYGIKLRTTEGVQAVEQSAASLGAARALAADLDDVMLTLLVHFTASFGSAILALAVMKNRLAVDTAFALSRLDEIYQSEHWGEDVEAIDKAAALLSELDAQSKLIEDWPN